MDKVSVVVRHVNEEIDSICVFKDKEAAYTEMATQFEEAIASFEEQKIEIVNGIYGNDISFAQIETESEMWYWEVFEDETVH